MTIRQRIEAWFKEEIELLIAKGATSQDLEEKAFEELLADNVSVRHFGEIQSDPELRKEIFGVTLRNALPEILREFASKLRDAGHANIEGAINHFVFKAGDLNFNAKSQYGEFVIEQKATVYCREVRKPQSKLHKPLTERIRKLLIPLQVLLPTCRRFSLSQRKLTQSPCDFCKNDSKGRGRTGLVNPMGNTSKAFRPKRRCLHPVSSA